MTYLKTVAAGAAALVLATSFALAASPRLGTTTGPIIVNPGQLGINPLACQVSGSPVEFPDDLRVINKGGTTIPAGTQISWKVPSMGMQGTAALPSSLAPNKSVLLSGVLAGGVEAGRTCSAKIA